jgi:DNA uptake protein ComE-like DNA-binding protein
MNTIQLSSQILLKDRLCLVLGVSESEAQAILDRRSKLTPKDIGRRVQLSQTTIAHILQNPSKVQKIRLNPNQITLEQIARIPHLKPERVDIVVNGRPYYAIEELESATALPRRQLEQLFEIPPFRFWDKITNKDVVMAPVPGRYIIPPKGELEEGDPADLSGYVETVPATTTFQFRVVEPSNFEAEQEPHRMKTALAGNVHPVLRDANGFERYLVPGSLDLWFRREIPQEQCRSIIQRFGLEVKNSVPSVGYYRVQLNQFPADHDITRAVFTLIDRVQKRPEIAFAEADQVGLNDYEPDISIQPIDEEFEEEFEASDRYWNFDAIELAGAHAITKGSANVTIFIIDSGTRMTHEDLQPAFRSDWETLDLNFDLGVPAQEKSPHEQTISHGTKVSGVIGAQRDVATVNSIAPNCRILPLKISGQSVTPAYGLRASAIRQALTYIRPGERAVINLSWQTNGEHIGIREALKEAQSKDVAVTTSAGNYASGAIQRPDDIHYPSAHTYRYPELTNLCVVAALGVGNRKASYSYYGHQSITVSAPGGEKGGIGTGIYTTSTPDVYAYTCGTSFAAPHVAGLIGLLFSVKPNLTSEDAIRIIKDTADPIDAMNPTYSGMLGTGRINAQAALERVGSTEPQAYAITATSGLHGSITPDGTTMVPHSTEQTFTILPDAGYQIQELLVDGRRVEPTTTYTFSNVTAAHTLAVQFTPIDQGEQSHYDSQGRLNINLATLTELVQLPYIDEWFGGRIIQYRTKHGYFSSIWNLSSVGMSGWAINQIKSLITFGPEK